MVSFSRLIAAESLTWTGVTFPFMVQNGTLLLREQTRSCLRKDCSALVRPDFPIRVLRRTQGIEASRHPASIGHRDPGTKPLIFRPPASGTGCRGFPPRGRYAARALGRRR